MNNNAIDISSYIAKTITIICFIAASGCVYKHRQWPEIKEINGSYKFDYKNNTEYKLTINSKSNKPLYYFIAKFFTENENDTDFNYAVGPESWTSGISGKDS